VASSNPPPFLAIGHATRDLLPDGGWQLGGTVTYAALTAQRLGLRAGIVTSGPPDLLDALREALPGVDISPVPSDEATTFENIYTNGYRRQFLRGRASALVLEHVPSSWRTPEIVLLAPLAQEVDPSLAGAFPDALVAATPQGWLRRWGADGLVSPCPLGEAERALPALDALILSVDDLRDEAEVQIVPWTDVVPLVVVTDGRHGASLLRGRTSKEHFAAYPMRELDPTGAGDVFAAAFLWNLHVTGDPRAAMTFAHQVAGLSIEHRGMSGIPTFADVALRFR
jgi:sugar/nucleoside kinase (ribokinase family)